MHHIKDEIQRSCRQVHQTIRIPCKLSLEMHQLEDGQDRKGFAGHVSLRKVSYPACVCELKSSFLLGLVSIPMSSGLRFLNMLNI